MNALRPCCPTPSRCIATISRATSTTACWHLARRDALRRAWLEALLELGKLHGTAGRHEQAIAIVQRAVDADAYGEAAHQELIRAYLRAGKRRQAVAQYKRLQAALSELRAAPAPETLALIAEPPARHSALGGF